MALNLRDESASLNSVASIIHVHLLPDTLAPLESKLYFIMGD